MNGRLRFDARFVADGEVELASSTGRYRLQERLGRGGAGEVWRAIDEDGSPVSAKIALREGIDDCSKEIHEEARLRRRHGAAFDRLTLPILDSGQIDCQYREGSFPLPWMIRRLAVGGVDKWVAPDPGPPPPLAARLEVLDRMIGLVIRLHALGVMHRDLKPANFLWFRPRAGPLELYLCDFGTVRDGEAGASVTVSTRGTDRYIPIEAHVGASSFAHDTFAMGVTAYEFIVGSQPAAWVDHTRLKFDVSGRGAAALRRWLDARGFDRRTGEGLQPPLSPEEVEHFRGATTSLNDPKLQERLLQSVQQALRLDFRARSLASLASGVRAVLDTLQPAGERQEGALAGRARELTARLRALRGDS